jgi:hypothetical protein
VLFVNDIRDFLNNKDRFLIHLNTNPAFYIQFLFIVNQGTSSGWTQRILLPDRLAFVSQNFEVEVA